MNDYDAVCALFRELDAHHVERLPDNFRAFEGVVRPVEQFREKVSSSGRAFFVAASNTSIIGFVDVQRDSNPLLPMFKAKEFALVDNLFVLAEFRGTGIAQVLFARAKAWAKDCGLSSIRLKVYAANIEANRFYQKEGLIPFNTTFEMDL